MRVVVNGASRTVPAGSTVADLVADAGADQASMAVALNGAVVPRAQWASSRVGDGDEVEILAAIQGGA